MMRLCVARLSGMAGTISHSKSPRYGSSGFNIDPDRGPNSKLVLNRGHLIETLNRDIPKLFSSPQDLTLFADDVRFEIEFEEREFHGSMTGLARYRRISDALRWAGRICLKTADVQHCLLPEQDLQQVRLRFRMTLIPRVEMVLHPMVVEGISTYLLTEDGFVHTHHITDVQRHDALQSHTDPLPALATPPLCSTKSNRIHSLT